MADSSLSAAESLWAAQNLPSEYLSCLHLSQNPDPVVDSSFKLGTVAQTTIGLSGLAAAYFHKLRTGVDQDVSVDARHAVVEFKSQNFYTIDDALPPGALFEELAGVYKTKDGYVRLHTNFPHHRQGILDILQCAPTCEAIADALSQWSAVELETTASARKMVATALRSFAEWDAHPHGQALAGTPPLQLIKIADAPKREVRGAPTRPLEGIRVLDLTRVLAGPSCGRTLAAHGADVLLVTSPNLPALPLTDPDTSRNKRTTQLDLTTAADRETLATLVKDADIFLQAYRPGGLREKGFGPEDVARARPGIVYASLTAYGFGGPWKDRRGYDSLVQTATGFNVAEGEAYVQSVGGSEDFKPKPFPVQALDYGAGYLLAFGINAALAKTITEGGSWEVRVSLAAVGQWIRSLGRLDLTGCFDRKLALPPRTIPLHPEIAALSVSVVRSMGDKGNSEQKQRMTAIRHAAMLSKTPVQEGKAPLTLDAHLPRWL
ncbi:CoA-transferase family III [Wolfiporia cocos MD-104 SS10]|uniref:CoA-transferase family III n=1 Tax=Wolfiporia cocos (strain MD-104) TaxID=742152 RepID=A0A2H3JEH4_WOLCO|nr:CoA-transferase family III [Wolfiporia cocos MD-104 SS10]